MQIVPPAFFSLRTRILALLSVSFIIMLSIMAYFAIVDREDDITNVITLIQKEAQRSAEQQREVIRSTQQFLTVLIQTHDVQEFITSNRCGAWFARLLKIQPSLANIAVAAPDGQVVCNATLTSKPISIAGRIHFQKALATDDSIIEEAVVSLSTGKWSLPFAKAIRDDAGRVQAVLVAALDIAWVNNKLAEANLPANSTVGLIDSKGTILARHPNPEKLVGQSAASAAFFKTMVAQGGTGTAEETGRDNLRRIFAFVRFAETASGPLYLWVSIPKHLALAHANREAQWIILGFVLFAASFAALWFACERLVLRPVSVMAETARKLGKGDFQARTGLRYSGDEAGELARTIDEMAAALMSKSDLLRLNRALRMLSECNQLLIHASDEQELLGEMCRHIVEVGGFRMAWVGYAEHDGSKTVCSVAQYGDDSRYLEHTVNTWDDTERGASPAGTAIRTGEPQLDTGLSTTPPFAPWHASALQHGYRSCAALPLRVKSDVLGALTIYSSEPDAFNSEEMKLLQELADDLAFGIMAQRVRRERESAEQAKEQYLRFFRLSPDPMVIADPFGCFRHINPALQRLTGYTEEELVARPFLDFVVPEDRERTAEEMKLQVAVRPSLRFENRYRCKDGSVVWLSWTAYFDRSDGVTYATAQDITERKRAQEKLERSEQSLKEAQRIAHMGNWDLDLVSNVLIWSDEIYRIFEIDPTQFGASYEAFLDTIHPDDCEFVNRCYTDSVKSRAPYDIVHRLFMKDGRIKHVHEQCETFYDANGKALRSIGTVQDVTERTQAEAVRTQLATIVESSSDAIIGKDLSGIITSWNPGAEAMYGYSAAEITGQSISLLAPADKQDEVRTLLKRLCRGETITNYETERIRQDGKRIDVSLTLSPIRDSSGRITGTSTIARDITQRKINENRIVRLSRIHAVLSGINSLIVRVQDRQELFEETCRIAVEHGGFGIAWIGTLEARTGRIVPVATCGDAASPGIALSASSVLGQEQAVPAIRENHTVLNNDLASTEVTAGESSEAIQRGYRSVIALPLTEGTTKSVLVLFAGEPDFFDEGELKLLDELAADISFALDHLAKAHQVRYLALYDTLTELPNRAFFIERLNQQLRESVTNEKTLVLVLLDVERFANINESYGRRAGDELLRTIATRLREALGEQPNLGRIESDRFAFTIEAVKQPADVAQYIERKLEECFARPYVVSADELLIAARTGVALFPGDGRDADVLFHNAESALANAKAGSEPFQFYSPEMNLRLAARFAMENKLRRALERGEFLLYYQPRVNTKSGQISGLEALLRWNDPQSSIVMPNEFIPILEDTGLIVPVGNWVLHQAASDYAAWQTKGLHPPHVAVNVSALQFRRKDFLSSLQKAANDSVRGLDLEITETVIMAHADEYLQKLHELKQMGCTIAIDDFGTGYSSLRYIAKLPIDTLKIDRSFIVGMTETPDDLAIAAMIISLGHELNLTVVAEGVESEEQAKLLRLLKCDEMQGYLFWKPMPAGEMERVLAAHVH